MYDDDPNVVRDREVVREERPRYADGPRYVAGPTPVDYVARIVKLLFGILQVLLILRIVFLLLIANRDNTIVQSILNITEPFVQPFVGMFRFDDVRSGTGSVLDIAAIVALIAWTIVEWLILAILNVFRNRGTAPAV